MRHCRAGRKQFLHPQHGRRRHAATAAGRHILLDGPPNPYCPSPKKPRRAEAPLSCASAAPSVRRRRKKPLPGPSPAATSASSEDRPETFGVSPAGTSLRRVAYARQPFRRRLVPSTTCQHANEIPLPCRTIARPRGRLLLGPHSPSTAFQTPGRPGRAPGTTPAAAEVPALAVDSVLQVTSLSGVIPRTPQPYVRPPGRHSLRRISRRFQGTEHGSIPLPAGYGFSRFGNVSCKTDWQALAGLSWLSSSQLPDLPEVPGPVTARIGRSPGSMLPTPARLNALGEREPPGRDYALRLHPLCSTAASTLARTRSVRIAPVRSAGRQPPPGKLRCLLHRIECRDFSAGARLAYETSRAPGGSITPTSLRRAQQATLAALRSTGRPHDGW